jgi:transcriptional regulator with XRE-family HTH domain
MSSNAEKTDHLHITLELIGKKLLDLRIKKGYASHAHFASDFKLPRIQYWRMEKGRANITIKSLGKVLDIHGLTLEDLFVQIRKENKKRK